MFTFLTRLGRLFVGTTVIVAVMAVIGVGSLTGGVLVASKQTSSSTGGSLALDSADPSFGASIKFSATFSPMKWIPQESISCTSNGQNVYLNSQVESSGASPWTSAWTLWSQTWANDGGGPASCVTQLYYFTWQGKTITGVVYLATSTFNAT